MLKRLSKLVRHNWQYKLLSLVFATLLWFFVTGTKPIQTTVKTHVVFNVPQDMVVASQSAEEISLSLRGPVSVMLGGSLQPIQMKPIDLAQFPIGSSVVILTESHFRNIPAGMTITQIAPARLVVDLDKVTTRIIAVQPRVTGEPAPGYAVASTSVSPPVVTLQGAQSQLEPIEQIWTEEVDIDGLTSPVSKMVLLERPDIPLIKMDIDQVKVSISIQERRVVREFTQALTWSNPPEEVRNYSIIPSRVKYRLEGAQQRLDPLVVEQDMDALVEVSPLRWEEASEATPKGEPVRIDIAPTVKPRVASDPAIRVLEVEPETITVLAYRKRGAGTTKRAPEKAPKEAPKPTPKPGGSPPPVAPDGR